MIDVHQVAIWSGVTLLPVSGTPGPRPGLGLEPGDLHLATLVSWMSPIPPLYDPDDGDFLPL